MKIQLTVPNGPFYISSSIRNEALQHLFVIFIVLKMIKFPSIPPCDHNVQANTLAENQVFMAKMWSISDRNIPNPELKYKNKQYHPFHMLDIGICKNVWET